MKVIEKGELVEFGTHEELMALNGRYKYLYGLQTDALADGVEDDKAKNASIDTSNDADSDASSVSGTTLPTDDSSEVSATPREAEKAEIVDTTKGGSSSDKKVSTASATKILPEKAEASVEINKVE